MVGSRAWPAGTTPAPGPRAWRPHALPTQALHGHAGITLQTAERKELQRALKKDGSPPAAPAEVSECPIR